MGSLEHYIDLYTNECAQIYIYIYIYNIPFHLFFSLKFSLDLTLNVATFLRDKYILLQTSTKYLGRGKQTEHMICCNTGTLTLLL